MISAMDKRLDELNAVYSAAFGERIPLMMIPESETIEDLSKKIDDSIKAGKNLLPEFYQWNDEDLY